MSNLLTEVFKKGIKTNTIRLRISVTFGISTIILLYAILNLHFADFNMFVLSVISCIMYFILLTPKKE